MGRDDRGPFFESDSLPVPVADEPSKIPRHLSCAGGPGEDILAAAAGFTVRRRVRILGDNHDPGAPMDAGGAYGTSLAQTIVQVLTQCGDDLSRENIMRQTMNLDMELPLLLPGIRLKTTETNKHPLDEFKLQQFDGAQWNLLADS